MERNNTRHLGLSMAAALLMSGCSDVSFSPSVVDPVQENQGKLVNEKFTQGYINNKLDILFVVDNSWSMSDEQRKMGEKINSFLSTLHDVDWQIGITTTDVSDGYYGIKGDLLTFAGTSSHILTKNTPNYEVAFKNTIMREESYTCANDCPSGLEQPLKAATLAISKRNSTNAGFFRNGTDLGVLVLSDADEMSSGGNDTSDPTYDPSNPAPTTPSQVMQAFRSAWTDSKNLYAFGMIVQPGDSACLDMQRKQTNGEGYYGTFINSLATMTGGLTGSICNSDYGPTLGSLAEKVRRLLDYVQLESYPDADSIKIVFTPDFATGWTLKGRRIFFDNPPPKGTVISVEYIVK